MKMNIELECTPEEARRFLGLPDVQPIQDMMSDRIQDRLESAMNMFDPEWLIKTWLPAGGNALDTVQKAFRGVAQTAARSTGVTATTSTKTGSKTKSKVKSKSGGKSGSKSRKK
jgi:hypothetical protein